MSKRIPHFTQNDNRSVFSTLPNSNENNQIVPLTKQQLGNRLWAQGPEGHTKDGQVEVTPLENTEGSKIIEENEEEDDNEESEGTIDYDPELPPQSPLNIQELCEPPYEEEEHS
ncbi:Hypothetical predicted protein [Mytilus galloprovincialis]|uniref:Uncharacterized protein n=1 Tax=Mytilus galloprovincialis TaxID=29158 RepID=A0A8B6FZJ1_MYTGA|nr:Hypothetical predicted protein [Mytilus galloprovincialis]